MEPNEGRFPERRVQNDERLLRLELRVDHVESQLSDLRAAIIDGRKVIDSLHEKISNIKDILTEHVDQENRDRVKLLIGISGALVVGVGVLVMFVFQLLSK